VVLLLTATVFSWLSWGEVLHAQPAEGRPRAGSEAAAPSLEVLEEQAKAAASSEQLDEEARKSVADLYRQAIDQARRAAVLEEQLGEFEAAAATATQRAETFKEKLERDRDRPSPRLDTSRPLPELEQLLAQSEQEVKDLKESLLKADEQNISRTARRKTIRERLLALKAQQESIASPPDSPPPNGESPVLGQAKRAERQTELALLRAEIPALEAELRALDAEDGVDLPRLARDATAQELTFAEEKLRRLQEVVQAKRSATANRQITSAKQDAEKETNPLLRFLALRNVDLAEAFQTLTQKMSEVEQELTATEKVRDYWTETAEAAKKKVEAIGLTDPIGAMLRKQKLELPSTRQFQASIARRSPRISAAQLKLLELEEERATDLEQTIRQNRELSAELTPEIREEAEALLTKRNELLAPLIRAQSDYFDSLVEQSNAEQQIVNQTQDYAQFIDERVLWIRSTAPLLSDLDIDQSDLRLLDKLRWQEAFDAILSDASAEIAWYALALAVFVGLLRYRLRFREWNQVLGQRAEHATCTSFAPTVHMLVLTIIAALAWPWLFAFLGWRVALVTGDNEVLKAVSHGCFILASGLFPLDFFRLTCRPTGLAEAHFGWPPRAVQLVRRSIRSLMYIGLPLILITAVLGTSNNALGRDTIQRVAFIAVTIALSLLASRLMHPRTGVFRETLAAHPQGWRSLLQPLWFWLAVLSPLGLTGLSFFGYHYTAKQLGWRLYLTACLLGAVVVAGALFLRWLLVQRRRLSMEQARQRRAAQLKASEDETAAAIADEMPTAEDLREQISQSQSLLKIVMTGVALLGVWATWVDVLPALGFLEQWPLWRSTSEVTEMLTDNAGEVTFKTREVIDFVTVADVGLALLILTITIAAARNIPGVLEISVLQRLPIEASVRYAITTLVSYSIVLLGIIVACNSLGIHWNQVQWMATALTFGLAFGLQEMFANFIAGIIILFERPIRVGDIVTIDDVTGTVTRVRIRATTVTNWDRKDYIVPNKDFITGRVLNWTLSDQVNRITVNVGVAYGSDKRKTSEILQRIVRDHHSVVDDPPPNVTFEEFGDSSLNYVVRCYIAMKDMPARLQVVHELHTAIDDAFREANIEIAFPQRDLHLRSVPQNSREQTADLVTRP
jgi:potassium efflux system protein